MTPEAKYEDLARHFSRRPNVTRITEGKGFGSSGQLKVDGKIFAMLVRDELVLKLPKARVDALMREGAGRHFDAGKGRPMREWLVLSPASRKPWLPLAQEAMEFVEGTR
jgi:hypothetical protein